MENHTIDIPTHYTTLGLAPSAPDAVIRAAYRALSLLHHPDKTFHLSPEERASHASIFRAVQEAYDVLGGTSKAAYDTELKCHGNRVDEKRSTFHRTPTTRKTTSTTPKRTSSIRLTTPEEKRAMKAKAEQDLAYLRGERAKRDAEDANMDIAGLKVMQKIWSDLSKECKDDPSLQEYCATQLQAYETKISKREQEHAEWLASMSKPKAAPETPLSKTTSASTPNAPRRAAAPRFTSASQNTGAPRSPTTDAVPASTLRQRQEERKRAKAPHAEQNTLHAQACAEEKARKVAAKQACIDVRADTIRAEKGKLKQKAEEQVKQAAKRIAKAKAAVVPKGTVGAGTPVGDEQASVSTARDVAGQGDRATRLGAKKLCGKCDVEHTSFAEWRKCNFRNTTQQNGDHEEEDSFFYVV